MTKQLTPIAVSSYVGNTIMAVGLTYTRAEGVFVVKRMNGETVGRIEVIDTRPAIDANYFRISESADGELMTKVAAAIAENLQELEEAYNEHYIGDSPWPFEDA